jgi:hypothetical protein
MQEGERGDTADVQGTVEWIYRVGKSSHSMRKALTLHLLSN